MIRRDAAVGSGRALGGAHARHELGTLRARAQARVSIDWHNVSDADVQRCGLSRLRAGTLERLVDDGHAVVDSVDSTGLEVRVSSVAGGLHIRVQARGISREDTSFCQKPAMQRSSSKRFPRIAELVRDVDEALVRLRPQSR